jgi:Na+-transporting methylmalonyl-CoA/oxaloacetate decarboxylase gamma subunit
MGVIFNFLLCLFYVLIGISPVFENRALRRIFGPDREEVKGGWRKLA